MKVLIGCEESQVITKAFRARGHEAYSCDLQDCSGGHPEWHIKGDVLDHLDEAWDLGIFHPVCKRLTNAGRRWLHEPPKDKTMVEIWREFFDGVAFYEQLRNAPIEKKAIENPIMHDHARECLKINKRQITQPWWFGDRTFKATGWELFNLPNLRPTNKLNPPKPGTQEHKEWSWVHRASPGKDREKIRSKFHPGMAQAIAEQWG